jgi:pimeloyl-ACP methyl ester carboxylesterase
MPDERAFITRVETADVDTFADLLEQPTQDEERALRDYFGDARYRYLHSLALRRERSGRDDGPKAGNVVVIHGFLGSDLTVEDRHGHAAHVWPHVSAIADGDLLRLRLAENGLQDAAPGDHVRATGIVKRYYGELLLTLAESWNVHAFHYDWRKNLDIAADRLHAQLSTWFDERDPVHLVTHGMGGLVARAFIERHQTRWDSIWDPGDGEDRLPGTRGGRLVMLSTPNQGSFEVVRTLSGMGTIQLLADLAPNIAATDLARVFASFVSPWQMLPSNHGRPELDPLYDPDTYGDRLDVPASRIAVAYDYHERLHKAVVDARRMVCINGMNRATVDGIKDVHKLSTMDGYTATWDGDGWVPASMSELIDPDGETVPIFHVDDDHGGLPSNRMLLAALDDVLLTGRSARLHEMPPIATGDRGNAIDFLARRRVDERSQLDAIVRRAPTGTVGRYAARASRDGAVASVSSNAREFEEFLTQGILHAQDDRVAGTMNGRSKPVRIEIRLVAGHLEDFDDELAVSSDTMPVDVVSVGLYLGSRPLIETRALDLAISAARPGMERDGGPSVLSETDRLIAQFAERGTIRGELGQVFLFDDPRLRTLGDHGSRLIAVVGMGLPGRFGEPELTLVARELCWTLGQLGKQHLATALIGIGRGNLSPQDATFAFLSGIKHAVTGMADDSRRALRRVTFIEPNPVTITIMQRAILAERDRLRDRQRLDIDFQPISDETLAGLRGQYRPRRRPDPDPDGAAVSRLTVTRKDDRTYRFGAITESAAIPERDVVIDPFLVEQANDGLAAAADLDSQLEEGQVLEKLLLPAEFRGQVYSSAPLVLMLDTAMARIHWEMIVQGSLPEGDGWRPFLGTSRSVTRQLHTTRSQPPDPPPPPKRTMRVLIVADPAADHRLPGAEAEGAAVELLFQQFNAVYEQTQNRVEVVTMLGPQEATRKNVMKALLLHSFDVLHFAGHCAYVEDKPESSGWIFTGGQLITAAELNRIDRIPNFIFSNACESGVTPDRSEQRSAGLGPSFAEAFFERGVTNIVCTAWPVDDVIARDFAVTLYEHLLGLEPVDADRRRGYQAAPPMQMHRAMREARTCIVDTPFGVRSWGAYQHYGNPYMRFFDPAGMTPTSG